MWKNIFHWFLGSYPLSIAGLYVIPLTLRVSNGLLTGIRSVYGSFWKDGCSRIKNMKFVSGSYGDGALH